MVEPDLRKVHPASVQEISDLLREEGPIVFGAFKGFSLPTDLRAAANRDAGRQVREMEPQLYDAFLQKGTEDPDFSEPMSGTFLTLKNLAGVIEHDVADQVVVVRGGTKIHDLQLELKKVGQCLPLLGYFHLEENPTDVAEFVSSYPSRLSDAILLNLPHGLEAQCGTWRDWVLGMTVVRADGTVVKCGSRAVKNVAGYDVQKLMIGSRGTLGVVVELILKTLPISAVPWHSVVPGPAVKLYEGSNLVQRVALSDLPEAVSRAEQWIVGADQLTGTLWCHVPHEIDLPRYPGDWLIRRDVGARNLQITDPTLIKYMTRAKDIFDPTRKLNPGEMGIF